ncbi:MAG: archease [Gammaproteobacteria bacterium]|nr:MAG: archease [Gammaproteobacteria bacterium]
MENSQIMWTHFHHEADIGIRGIGSTREEAFEEVAMALTAVMTDPDSVRCNEKVNLDCEAPDPELLLVDWLNALIFEMATRKMLFSRFNVEFDGPSLHATACGESIDVLRHQPAAEVKGATYTELALCQDEPGKWRAQCVVDV